MIDESFLRDVLGQYVNVRFASATIVRDKMTNPAKSKGYAFVVFESELDVERAMADLHEATEQINHSELLNDPTWPPVHSGSKISNSFPHLTNLAEKANDGDTTDERSVPKFRREKLYLRNKMIVIDVVRKGETTFIPMHLR